MEHGFRVAEKLAAIPDIAIIRTERLAHGKGNSPTAGAPEIAMEVAISDSSIVLQRKVSGYLRNGAEAVCYIYPDLRKIIIYTAHEWRELGDGDNLESPTLLPGISIPVTDIFEGVEA
jgi:Uma2 family endonuclease